MCKFVTGLKTKKCKLNSGRDNNAFAQNHTHCQFTPANAKPKLGKKYGFPALIDKQNGKKASREHYISVMRAKVLK